MSNFLPLSAEALTQYRFGLVMLWSFPFDIYGEIWSLNVNMWEMVKGEKNVSKKKLILRVPLSTFLTLELGDSMRTWHLCKY